MYFFAFCTFAFKDGLTLKVTISFSREDLQSQLTLVNRGNLLTSYNMYMCSCSVNYLSYYSFASVPWKGMRWISSSSVDIFRTFLENKNWKCLHNTFSCPQAWFSFILQPLALSCHKNRLLHRTPLLVVEGMLRYFQRGYLVKWGRIRVVSSAFKIEPIVQPTRRACALRALGLLLADGAPTVGGGKTFWRVN